MAEAKKKTETIRLFSDGGKYKGDLFVSVNGVHYQLQRGKNIEVPPEVADFRNIRSDQFVRIQFAASEDGEVSCSGGNIHDVLWAEGTEPGNSFTAPAAVYT